MSVELSLERITGALRLGDRVTLAPFSQAATLEAALQAFAHSLRDMETGWIWADVPGVALDGLPCVLSLALEAGMFREWRVGVARGGPAWPTEPESAEDEEKLARALGTLLQLGAPLRTQGFSWGEAWCGRDAKGGFASAGARYKRPDEMPPRPLRQSSEGG